MQNEVINSLPDSLISSSLLSADTVSVLPAAMAWPESYVAVGDIIEESVGINISFIDSIANLAIVIAIIGLFLFAYSRILEGVYAVTVSAFNIKKLLAIERQANLYGSRNILLVFSLAISAFIFVNYNDTQFSLPGDSSLGVRFILILLAVFLYFLLRYVVFKVMDWTNEKSIFKYINRFYYTHTIMGILLLFIGFICVLILPPISQGVMLTYIICAIACTLILYFIRGYQIIISNGFSHFFWILYLCTLEILPTLAILHLTLS